MNHVNKQNAFELKTGKKKVQKKKPSSLNTFDSEKAITVLRYTYYKCCVCKKPFKELYWAADEEVVALEKGGFKKYNSPALSMMLINESIFYYSGSGSSTASLELQQKMRDIR